MSAVAMGSAVRRPRVDPEGLVAVLRAGARESDIAAWIDAGADVSEPISGTTPLEAAIGRLRTMRTPDECGVDVAVRMLVAAGADPDRPRRDGVTPLGSALDAAAAHGDLVATAAGILPSLPPRDDVIPAIVALLEAGSGPVDMDPHPGPDSIRHGGILPFERRDRVLMAVADAVPERLVWRWCAMRSLLTGAPMSPVAIVDRPPPTGPIERFVDLFRPRRHRPRTVAPDDRDVAWATTWIARRPGHPRALELLAACGGAR